MAALRDAMPSGSYLAVSSLRLPGLELPELRALTMGGEKVMTETLRPMRWRDDQEILSWFGGWELVSPGLVPLADWRPPVQGHTPYPELRESFSGGVAIKS
jgi:hypothetical protein